MSTTDANHIRQYIREHLATGLDLPQLAALVDLSPHYFSSLFKSTFGVPPHRYVLGERVAESRRLLLAGNLPIAAIAAATGFSSQSHLCGAFKSSTGLTPGQILPSPH